LDTFPVTARHLGRYFKTDGNNLERAYKHHLSGFEGWNQKEHAQDWILLAENFGEKMSIDETMLCDDLVTIFSNKAGKGKHGTLAAAIVGTAVEDVLKILLQVPEEIRRRVKEVTMDFSDSMYSIIRQAFPWATIVIDCFHIMQLAGKAPEEMRLKLKRAARKELKKQECEFKKQQQKRAKYRAKYAKTHKPKKSKNGKQLGRPRKRKNEKFEPERLDNGETKVDLLTHVRYPLLKSGDEWTEFQKKEMKILFELDPRMKKAYGLLCALRNIFKKKQSREKARKALRAWYKNVGKSLIRELIAVRDTIKSKEEYVLNYFNNRSTNASAESLNSKMKGFRTQVRGVSDLPFFMYRCMMIFG
jgi:transposase